MIGLTLCVLGLQSIYFGVWPTSSSTTPAGPENAGGGCFAIRAQFIASGSLGSASAADHHLLLHPRISLQNPSSTINHLADDQALFIPSILNVLFALLLRRRSSTEGRKFNSLTWIDAWFGRHRPPRHRQGRRAVAFRFIRSSGTVGIVRQGRGATSAPGRATYIRSMLPRLALGHAGRYALADDLDRHDKVTRIEALPAAARCALQIDQPRRSCCPCPSSASRSPS